MTAFLHDHSHIGWRETSRLPAFTGAALMTAALFSLMTLLISSQGPDLDRAPALPPIVIDLPDRDLPEVKEIKPDRPVEEQAPKQPERTDPKVTTGTTKGPVISVPGPGGPEGPPTSFGNDRPAARIFAIPPAYPPRAQEMGLEGYVIIGFDVAPTGSVARAWVEFSTSSIFERAALRAVEKWRYQPKVIDGKAVAQPGQRVRVTFALED